MLNLAINRNKSKEFIRFYEEKEDKIIVYYGNLTRQEFENNRTIKNKLNSTLERQVIDGIDYFKQRHKFLDEREYTGRLCFVYSIFTGLIGSVAIPVSNFFSLNNNFSEVMYTTSALLLIHPITNIVKGINLSKYVLFLDNKDNINSYLASKSIDNEKKELSINDVKNINILGMVYTTIRANRYARDLELKRIRANMIIKKDKVKTLSYNK